MISRTLSYLVLLALLCGPVHAKPVKTEHVEAELVAEMSSVKPGTPFRVGLRLKMDPHWHTYWRFAGDAGLPTTIEWELPEGFEAGSLQWPVPKSIMVSGLVNLGYEDEVLLPVLITPPASLGAATSVLLKAQADWLVCKEVCMPGSAALELELPVVNADPEPNEDWQPLFQRADEAMPLEDGRWAASASMTGNMISLTVTPPATHQGTTKTATFYPYDYGMTLLETPQQWVRKDASYVLTMARDPNADPPPTAIEGILVSDDGWGAKGKSKALYVSATLAEDAGGAAAKRSSPLTLLLAFVGGLILNLMPCVFPVLGLKIMSFANQAGEDRRRITLHGLVFTAGVVVSFWILSGLLIFLRASGQELGWGFQLQSPAFVFTLSVLLLVFALNLSGLFEVGTSLTSVGGGLMMKSGYTGSFFTGVLATVVATPCAAPILAPAIGVALALQPLDSLLVFTFIALGLATPYLLLSAFPALVAKLPRPGAWMVTFKQFMAFLLYATVAYLVWVLAGQVDDLAFRDILFALVLVALAGWVYGVWTAPTRKTSARTRGLVAAVLVLAAGLYLGYAAMRPSELKWEKWSEARVAELRSEDRPVYVDFTARWCATCQVNKGVLYSDRLVAAFLKKDVVLLKADWTNRDPAITAALEKLGRSAVPVNLYYAPGAEEPVMLPEILTPGIVLDVLGG